MSCSTLPAGQDFVAETSSRIPLSWSLAASPADQRRLQRTMEGGIGFSFRQAPLANWKKSVHGSALRSMSLVWIPRRAGSAPSVAGAIASMATVKILNLSLMKASYRERAGVFRICRAARRPLTSAPATVPISSGSVVSPAK